MDIGFTDVIDETGLAERYRPPRQLVLDKVVDHLDSGCRDLVTASTLVLVGTSGPEGHLDVSPRGGPPGFVVVLDDHRLAIPDRNGNNRLDTLRNVVATGEVGLLFVVPGQGETLRVNGRACVTVADDVLDRCTGELVRPTAAIGVEVREAFVHCAKAFRRGGVWDPTTWPGADDGPDVGRALADHVGLVGVSGEQVRTDLEAGYRRDLEAERATPA